MFTFQNFTTGFTLSTAKTTPAMFAPTVLQSARSQTPTRAEMLSNYGTETFEGTHG